MSDVIDRLYFNVAEFTKEDWGLLVATVVISALDAYTKYNIEWLLSKIIPKWLMLKKY